MPPYWERLCPLLPHPPRSWQGPENRALKEEEPLQTISSRCILHLTKSTYFGCTIQRSSVTLHGLKSVLGRFHPDVSSYKSVIPPAPGSHSSTFSLVLPFLGIAHAWDLNYVVFCVGLLCHNVFKFHRVVAPIRAPLLPMAEPYSIVWLDHAFFICSPVDGLLGCFPQIGCFPLFFIQRIALLLYS